MSCITCKVYQLPACPDSLTIDAGFDADTEYEFTLIDQFGNKYVRSFTSDEDGVITIDPEDMRENIFEEFSGVYRLEITDRVFTFYPYGEPEVTFPCIQMTFHSIDGVTVAEIK